jgi:2-methylcitrate dehydratase PrpD
LAVAAPVLRTIAEPREQKIRPLTGYHAKFSGPYTVARALLGGGGLGLYLEDFTADALADPAVHQLMPKVHVVADERATDLFPNTFAAALRVRTTAGTTLEHRVDSSRGGPGNPLTRDELLYKFRLNAGRILSTPALDKVLSVVDSLDHPDGDLATLMPLLAEPDVTSAAEPPALHVAVAGHHAVAPA